jgi:hypothetical protein
MFRFRKIASVKKMSTRLLVEAKEGNVAKSVERLLIAANMNAIEDVMKDLVHHVQEIR